MEVSASLYSPWPPGHGGIYLDVFDLITDAVTIVRYCDVSYPKFRALIGRPGGRTGMSILTFHANLGIPELLFHMFHILHERSGLLLA